MIEIRGTKSVVDSGAPVFDLRGRIVGMLIGGNLDDRSGYPRYWLTGRADSRLYPEDPPRTPTNG